MCSEMVMVGEDEGISYPGICVKNEGEDDKVNGRDKSGLFCI